jgi:orotidine-5'-phosphate decarboxylase
VLIGGEHLQPDFVETSGIAERGAGMDFVRELKAQGHRVFIDKLCDIAETVKRAVAQVAKVGADFLTVHGSRAVMAAAVAGRGDSSLKLLAVTVLTSFDETDLRQMGYSCGLATPAELRVRNAMDAGIDGVVCHPSKQHGYGRSPDGARRW